MFGHVEMKKAIAYILRVRSGYRRDLINEFDEKIVEDLSSLGYITQGATLHRENGLYESTWKKTKKAESYDRFFISELTDNEREGGYYLHSLGF